VVPSFKTAYNYSCLDDRTFDKSVLRAGNVISSSIGIILSKTLLSTLGGLNVAPQAPAENEDVRNKSVTMVLQRRVAVLIPCYNEELTVGTVVRQFRAELPGAGIYVFDNNSIDRTSEEARVAGAIVMRERRQGKGYVVQSMFQRVDADIYVMVDGDATYNTAAVHALIQPVLKQEAEMVVGSRLHSDSKSEFKKFNRFGNRILLGVLNSVFHVRLTDILSGYRAFSREFVKNIPIFAGGFQIEAELTIKALERGYRIQEIPIDLNSRPDGSFSKIRHVHDGMLILQMIVSLFRDYKPLTFFGSLGLLAMAAGLVLGVPVISEFLRTGLVPRLPSAVLAVGLVLAGMLTIAVGLILHTTARRFQELEYQLRSVGNGVAATGKVRS
jgi:glycosyltransferase involved in cell wall biosynthesis